VAGSSKTIELPNETNESLGQQRNLSLEIKHKKDQKKNLLFMAV
jgi:hypothetical protein